MFKNNYLRCLIIFLAFISCFLNANNLLSVEKGVSEHSDSFYNFSGIITSRLILRKIEPTDLDDIFEFTSDPEMVKFTPIFDLTITKIEAQDYIKNIIDNYNKGIPDYWAIVYKENNKVIGIICIDILYKYRADIGYAVARDYWSKGIATEATKAVIDFGFKTLGLKRIEGTCDPLNIASSRVLEKCGMKYEGLLKSCCYLRGEFCDRKLYAIIQ